MDAEVAICNLARHLGVELDPRDVSLDLRAEPSYPSLLAVTRTVDALGIGQIAATVAPELLGDVAPAIAGTEAGLVVVEAADGNQVTLIDPERGRVTVARDAFESTWNGTVVFCDGGERSTHTRRRLEGARRRRVRGRAALAALATLWVVWLVAVASPGPPVLLVLIASNLLGIAASIALVGLAFGFSTALGRALCPAEGPDTGCRMVLRSRVARIFGLGLAEVGLCYFAAQHLVLACAVTGSGRAWAVAGLVPLLLLPIPVLAVAYQALVLRRWCRLCLQVQVVLTVQAGVALHLLEGTVVDSQLLVFVLAAHAAALAGWITVRRWLSFWLERTTVLTDLARLRRAPRRIDELLAGAETLELGDLAGDIVRGPADAPVRLEVVTSLECEGCRLAFAELDDLLGRSGDAVQARLRFIGRARTRPAQRACDAALGRALRGDHDGAWEILAAHFQANPRRPGRSAPVEPSMDEIAVARALRDHEAWCRRHGIRMTPTRIVNGRMLDPRYSIADLSGYLLTSHQGRHAPASSAAER